MGWLTDLLASFVAAHVPSLPERYHWQFKLEQVPVSVSWQGDDWYLLTRQLKQALHLAWQTGDANTRQHLINWFITKWGGVIANRVETMLFYGSVPAEALMAKGKTGVASWSKALVVHHPERYAIYDARVAVSLNTLQLLFGAEKPLLFPLLASRNKTVMAANAHLRRIAKFQSWQRLPDQGFYSHYLQLLHEVAKRCACHVQDVEMVLFSQTEELCAQLATFKR